MKEGVGNFVVSSSDRWIGRSPLSSVSNSIATVSTSEDTSSSSSSSSSSSTLQWRQKAEDLLWLASAIFILYYGDLHSNFFSLLAHDPRIWRCPLHIGSICLLVDFFLLLSLAISLQTKQEKADLLILNSIQAPTIIGFVAFILFSAALWPIWNILTIPMLFTLFMASVVMFPYLLPYMDVKMDLESLGYLCFRS